MKRTLIYLRENFWKALQILSRQQRTTIPELVRRAVEDKYGSPSLNRRQAMQAVVGLWRNRKDLPDAEAYVRRLRKGTRLRRIAS